jgi:Fe-S-cluster containining protein
MQKNNKQSLQKPKRLSYPSDEKKVQWLPMLLDTYFLADKIIYDGLRRELKKGKTLACACNCSNCCYTHTTIPVYPLEVVGLYWYVIEKISGKRRYHIQAQLQAHGDIQCCPFLVKDRCGIHPMRPMACRFFNVFNKVCAENEDPFYSRRYDVFTPNESLKNKALMKMLPFHEFFGKQEQEQAINNNTLNNMVQNLHEIDWPKIAKRMESS